MSFDDVTLSIPTAADPTGTVPGAPAAVGGVGATVGSATENTISGGTIGPNGGPLGSTLASRGPGGTVLVPGQGYTATQLPSLLKTPRGRCTIWGTRGNDHLVGTPGRDVICGLGGNDRISGGSGDDVIYGDAGNASRLVTGNDRINAGAGNDIVHGGPGNDTIRSASNH